MKLCNMNFDDGEDDYSPDPDGSERIEKDLNEKN